MDKDPRENAIDPVERVSPTTGDNDTGDSGDAQARQTETPKKPDADRRGHEPGRKPYGYDT